MVKMSLWNINKIKNINNLKETTKLDGIQFSSVANEIYIKKIILIGFLFFFFFVLASTDNGVSALYLFFMYIRIIMNVGWDF